MIVVEYQCLKLLSDTYRIKPVAYNYKTKHLLTQEIATILNADLSAANRA
jgi:hypothetical protein